MPPGNRGPRSYRALLALAAVGCAALLGAGSPAAHASGATTTLSNDVVHNLSYATLTGSVPATQTVTVGVFLSNPNQAAEDAYVKQLYDPSSPNYGNYLDPDTFNSQFGVPAAKFQAAQAWLQGAGLTVTPIESSTQYVLASGSAAQVGAAFGTPLNNYTANGRSFYANTLAPKVPASLGVSYVYGLNNFNKLSIPRVQATGPWTTGTQDATSGNVPKTGLLSIRDLWSIYDAPSTNLGNGQTMAIFGWGVTDPVVPDLRSFEAEWALPGVPITVKRYGDTSTPDTSGDGATTEWELDTQASTGMAPNVTSETLYFAHHNTDTDVLASIVGWVNDKNGPLQGSASYGECENVGNANAILTDGLEVPGDKVLEQGVIEGRTLFASTGDTGSSCPILANTNGVATQVYPGLEWPSVSPWAVAVGGTVLQGDGNTPEKRLDETAWAFTGGGNSTSEPAGSYQQGVAKTNCTFDSAGNPTILGPLCRSTPDVATISGDVVTGNGLSINDDAGADQQGAGTSLSSPLWVGVWARIQAAAKSSKGLGFANYKIYKLAQSSGGRDFYDVTVGDNQPYPATPGYDNTTGWGTPEIAQIMQDLTGRLTPAHNTTPAPIVTSPSTTCGSLFTDPAGDDNYSFGVGAGQGASPQLDILSGRAFLSADGQTLKTIITVNNLSSVIPTGGGENDYQLNFTYQGTQYFTQLAVEPSGDVLAWDGQLVKVSLENKYLQEHLVTGTITPGPNGTAEVDAPISDFTGLSAGSTLLRPSAATYVREGVNQGPLEPADSAGPTYDDVLGACTS
jgi:pseudomonalisin